MKHFHGFKLDTTNHCLWRGDERVSLTPKAFDLLRYLVEHANRLVTHDEILEALWPSTYVNQEVVKKYVLGIRKVLGDRRDQPQFVRTFPKRGYQFVAPVSEDRPPAADRAASPASALIGRRTLRERLDSCLSRAAGGTRHVVFVTGEAGIGKTTFVDSFVQRAGQMSNARVARGQCIEAFGGQEAYYPLLEAIDQLVRRSDDEHFVSVLRQRAPTWLLQFPALVKSDERDVLRRDTLGATRERMVREICEMLEAIAQDRLMILVLEDLHWADPATLDVVSTFARRREGAQVLLVVTQRPPDGTLNAAASRLLHDLEIRGLCEQISLEPFERSDVTEYLALEFGHAEFASDLAAVIHRQSGGNPLIVSAVARDLVASGTIVNEADGWTLTAPIPTIELRVPASLQEMINLQFDQLSPLEQSGLKAASVVGERFPVWLLASAPDTLEDLERVCEQLAERRIFIRPVGMIELPNETISAQYEFRHALYRQAIYGRLSDISAVRLHRAVGDRLEALHGRTASAATETAAHFEKAHEPERAIRHLMLAADNAARRFAVRDSLEVLQYAISLVPDVPSHRRAALEIQILERIGDAQYTLGAMVESALAYETESAVAARAGLIAQRVQAQTCFARALGLLDPDRAIATLKEATAASAAIPDPVMQARVNLLAASTRLLYDGWSAADIGICDAADGVLLRAGEENAAAFDRMLYAHAQALRGDALEALRATEAGISQSNDATSVMVHLFALSARILALLQLGRFGDALRIIRDSQSLAHKNRSDPWLFQYREAWLRMLAMDFAGAQGACDELVRSSVYPTGQAQSIGRLAAGFDALDHDRHDEARRSFEAVRDPAQTPKFFMHWYWRMHAHVGLTRAWLQSGDVTNARHEAARVTDAAASVADPNLRALAWETRAQVAIAESNWGDAGQSIAQALDALEGIESSVAAWQVHATASEFNRRTGQIDVATAHRTSAQAHIAALVESFPPGEPLRDVLLAARAIRRIRREEMEVES